MISGRIKKKLFLTVGKNAGNTIIYCNDVSFDVDLSKVLNLLWLEI